MNRKRNILFSFPQGEILSGCFSHALHLRAISAGEKEEKLEAAWALKTHRGVCWGRVHSKSDARGKCRNKPVFHWEDRDPAYLWYPLSDVSIIFFDFYKYLLLEGW